MLYSDGNIACYHGVAEEKFHAFLYFQSNSIDLADARQCTEKFLPIDETIDFKAVRRGKARDCKRILPLVGIGRSDNWLVLAYPYLSVLPLSVKLKTSPALSRLAALQFVLDATEALYNLHKVRLICTDVHLGNVFVDVKGRAYVGYNRGIGVEAHRKYYKSNVLVKHFDVIAPELEVPLLEEEEVLPPLIVPLVGKPLNLKKSLGVGPGCADKAKFGQPEIQLGVLPPVAVVFPFTSWKAVCTRVLMPS